METKQKTNNVGGDPCMWCCFPCLIVWLSLEKCLQTSCLCCCQILACDFKSTANEKINEKQDNVEGNIDDENVEQEFIEIVPRPNRLSAKSNNASFILYLIIQQLPDMKDDDKNLLLTSIEEYNFDKDYEFSFTGKSKYVYFRNSKDINWIASINQQTLDIAESWCKYDRESGIKGLIERYK